MKRLPHIALLLLALSSCRPPADPAAPVWVFDGNDLQQHFGKEVHLVGIYRLQSLDQNPHHKVFRGDAAVELYRGGRVLILPPDGKLVERPAEELAQCKDRPVMAIGTVRPHVFGSPGYAQLSMLAITLRDSLRPL
jgi:hypothetical protein